MDMNKKLALAPEEDDAQESAKSTPPGSARKASKGQMICCICGDPCKKTAHSYGGCCRKDVEACKADAESVGGDALAHFEEQAKNTESLRLLVLRYQLTCPSGGSGKRRAHYDWVVERGIIPTLISQGRDLRVELPDLVLLWGFDGCSVVDATKKLHKFISTLHFEKGTWKQRHSNRYVSDWGSAVEICYGEDKTVGKSRTYTDDKIVFFRKKKIFFQKKDLRHYFPLIPTVPLIGGLVFRFRWNAILQVR